MQKLESPIVLIEAKHSDSKARAENSTRGSKAGNLDGKAYYCIGARVLLTKNVLQVTGLCNGATGKIVDIVYEASNEEEASTKKAPHLPEYILVDFGKDYTGPSFFFK